MSVPAKPFLFTSILSDFRELFREDAAHRMRTPSSSALLDGMCSLKKTHSRRGGRRCRPSLQLTTKGEPSSLSNFFCQRWFSGNEQNDSLRILTDVKRISQMNGGRLQKSRDLTLASLCTKRRCRQTRETCSTGAHSQEGSGYNRVLY